MLLSLVLIKFYMYKKTTQRPFPSQFITKCSWPVLGKQLTCDVNQEVFSTTNPPKISTNMTSTASESTIVGNTPTSSSTAAINPKSPCEAVIVYFDKARLLIPGHY